MLQILKRCGYGGECVVCFGRMGLVIFQSFGHTINSFLLVLKLLLQPVDMVNLLLNFGFHCCEFGLDHRRDNCGFLGGRLVNGVTEGNPAVGGFGSLGSG